MISNNYIDTDNNGNEYSQYETTDATSYLSQSRFTPQEKEAGMLTITYNAVNTVTGAATNKMKIVRYKMINSVTALIGATTIFNNTDTGMTAADVVAAVNGVDVLLSITGVTGANIRHTIKVERLSSKLR